MLSFGTVYGVYSSLYPWPVFRNNAARSGYLSITTPDTNSTLWSWTATSGYPKNPIIAEGVVYVNSYDDLYAIDETTGSLLWTVDVNGVTSSSNIGDRGATFSDGKLYVGDLEGYMWCINATSGQELWHWPISIPPGDIQNSPAVANGKVYFGTADGASGNNYLVALNATDGDQIWQYSAPDNSILSSPAVDGTWIFFGCEDEKIYALNDTGNFATLKWSLTTQARIRSTPCVYGELLIFGTGSTDHSIFAVNKTNGDMIWSFELGSYYEISSSVAVVNDIAYFTSPLRYVYALNASIAPGSYSESSPGQIVLWRSLQIAQSNLRSPVVSDDKVFFTAGTVLYALDVDNGLVLWSYGFGSTCYDEGPVIADGRIFVTSYQDLHCFGDFYPLNVYNYQATGTGYEFNIEVIANATCTGIDTTDLESEMKLRYTLDANWNENYMVMSNVTVPHDMLGGPYTLTVDGGGPDSVTYDANATHTTIYFTYLHESHGSHEIEVTGQSVIPEFPAFNTILLLALFSVMAMALLKKNQLRS
jgi:outer membrane protein assembly factor BamB